MSSEFIDSLMDILESWGGSWVVEQGREAGWGVAAVYPVCRMVLLFWSIAAAYLPACYRLSSIVTFLPTKSSITVGLAFAGHSNLISCHAVHGPSLVWACSASSPAETISWIRHGSIFCCCCWSTGGAHMSLDPQVASVKSPVGQASVGIVWPSLWPSICPWMNLEWIWIIMSYIGQCVCALVTYHLSEGSSRALTDDDFHYCGLLRTLYNVLYHGTIQYYCNEDIKWAMVDRWSDRQRLELVLLTLKPWLLPLKF